MALKRKQEPKVPAAGLEQGSVLEVRNEEKPLLLVALHHDWYEASTNQRFPLGVPTEPILYTQWLRCQVEAGNMEVEQ